MTIKTQFIESWKNDIRNIVRNPSLRTYTMIKSEFTSEPYLHILKNKKYQAAFSRFRAGSHTLEIERGRYMNPRVPVDKRLCLTCGVIEDEVHFLLNCSI